MSVDASKRGRDTDATPSPEESSDEEAAPMPMPAAGGAQAPQRAKKRKKRKVLEFERVYLESLPAAEMYEKSYMHRDVVTHVTVTPFTEFVVTASRDGHLKFWKKMAQGIEFVKHYKAHLSAVHSLSASADGLRLCTTAADQAAKFYDVATFDMINMFRLEFTPTASCWVHKVQSPRSIIAIADAEAPVVRVYDAEGVAEPLRTVGLHSAPVLVMAHCPTSHCVVSGDAKGMLEYWDADTGKLPEVGLKFKYKTETSLYELAKCRTVPTSLAFSPSGTDFVVCARDGNVRIFRFCTGKMRRKYDESLAVLEAARRDGTLDTLGIDAIDFGRRGASERELQHTTDAPASNALFDQTGHFLLFPTAVGIKILNVETNRVCGLLGKVESTERFLALALYQGTPKTDTTHIANQAAKARTMDGPVGPQPDPMLVCASFKKKRFFVFSRREPADEEEAGTGRDVFNEKPSAEEQHVVATVAKTVLGRSAVLRTTLGDIHVKLFADECPKTVENFTVHSRNGYYDNLLFHRVIKNFMVQTGDPLGDGTGGESIWGGEFEDEFNRNLRHDRPFTLSMANAGPGTNGMSPLAGLLLNVADPGTD